MIRNIIFDFDGTIADTFEANVSAVLDIARKKGYSFNHDIEYFRDKDMKQIVRKELKIPLFRIPGLVREIRPMIRDRDIKSRVFPGVKAAIKEISLSHEVGILSSNSEETIKKFLERNGIDSVRFVHSDDTLFGKEKALKRMMKRHGLKRDETLYLGDEVRDIEASRKARVRCVAVSWGFNSRHLLEKSHPDFVVDKPEELMKIVKSL